MAHKICFCIPILWFSSSEEGCEDSSSTHNDGTIAESGSSNANVTVAEASSPNSFKGPKTSVVLHEDIPDATVAEASSPNSFKGPKTSVVLHEDIPVSHQENVDVDVDLDSLIKYISDFLERTEEKKSLHPVPRPTGSNWTWPTGSDFQNLQELLSSGIDLASDLKTVVSGHVKNILKALGHASVVTAGILVVAYSMERFEEVSTNRKDCLHLLHEMHYVGTIVKKLKGSPKRMRAVIEEAITLIVEGAATCLMQINSSPWNKFFLASGNKEKLSDVTKRLDNMYKHIAIEINLRLLEDIECKEKPLLSRGYPEQAVGIQESIREVVDLLDWGSEQNAQAVILHGFGGMGKTTLADAVFSVLDIPGCKYSKVKLFEEIGSTSKIVGLQNNILADLKGSENIREIRGYEDGQRELGAVLQKVHAIIYIDNVLGKRELAQLLPLRVHMDKAKKVRLLITARELNVSEACPLKTIEYQMGRISSTEAKRLFVGMEGILDPKQLNFIIEKCGGIPLMLTLVAGALFVAKDKMDKTEACEVIEELEKSKGENFGPDKMESYFFAYDKLPKECKDAFLDICKFFHRWNWDTVTDIVGKVELKMLKNRALVSKDTAGHVRVHDIILHLGRQKSTEDRFRLTNASQVEKWLDQKDEQDIQAITCMWLRRNEKPMEMSASKLDLMHNSLRVLDLGRLAKVNGECSKKFEKLVFFRGDVTHLPFDVSELKELKYLNYTPKDLKLSEMPSSLRNLLLYGHLHSQTLQISSTDLQKLGNLTILKLNDFAMLKHLPNDMGDLVMNLQELSLEFCTTIEKLPESISSLRYLRILKLTGCKSLLELPVDFGSLNSLHKLHLSRCCNLKALPNSLENLSSLELLDLSRCTSLLNLPPGLGNLASLVKLYLNNCSTLESIPESIGELKVLDPILDMSDCLRLKELPNGFCNLSCITNLSLPGCFVLEKLPDGFGQLTSLRALDLQSCETLEKLPEGFGQLKCLEELVLKGCVRLRQLCSDFQYLSSLQTLELSYCHMLEKLPENFHSLASLQHLHLRFCNKLEGKWMDHVVKINRLQLVHIEGSEQLVKRWEEIQGEAGDQSWPFHVTAGQALSMSEDQKEIVNKALLSDFDQMITDGQGQPICLSDLPADTLFLVVCDVCPKVFIDSFPWPLIKQAVDEIQTRFQIIYIGPHFRDLPKKVRDRIFVGQMTETRARDFVEKVCLTVDAGTDSSIHCTCIFDGVVTYELHHYFQMQTKMVGNGNKPRLCYKPLIAGEMEEFLFSNCGRYIRLKQLVETPQESNIKLLRELFVAPEETEITPVFRKYASEQDRTESSEPSTCGIDKLKGKNILLEMRPVELCHDIRLSSLKELYVENERLNLEIISIPVVDPDTDLDILHEAYKQFSTNVPWLVLQNSWTVITNAVNFFLAKHCGFEEGKEYEKCYTGIIWIIETNGRITTYKSSVISMLDKWDVFFSHLESVSCQVRWGRKACPLMREKFEELRKEEWKQLSSMSTLKFICNHLESVSAQVNEVMFQGKMICLYSGTTENVTSCIRNSVMEVRDSMHIIYIPGNMKTLSLTGFIKKNCYYPWEMNGEMEDISLLNLSGDGAVRFWMRLLHLKEEINGMDNTDKQFCEMRRLLNSFQLTSEYYMAAGCMIFMQEDGKMVATCRQEILKWLFPLDYNREDRAKRLMQLLIKVSMEEGNQTHHDSNISDPATNNIQTAANAVDEETVDLDLDLDSLSQYTSDLLEHNELYQLLEFNKEGKISSRPKARLNWPTSEGFSMLKNFLSEGINANWVKDISSCHPKENTRETIMKHLLKGIGEAHWVTAGFLLVADGLERFESISSHRDEHLFILDEMNRLAIYIKQLDQRPGLWTGMKRESIAAIVIGSILCCDQIDYTKFHLFENGPMGKELLSTYESWFIRNGDIMADSITKGLSSESGSLLRSMSGFDPEREEEGGPNSAKASATVTAGEESVTSSTSSVAAPNGTYDIRGSQPS